MKRFEALVEECRVEGKELTQALLVKAATGAHVGHLPVDPRRRATTLLGRCIECKPETTNLSSKAASAR